MTLCRSFWVLWGVPLTGKRSIAPVRQTLFLFTRQSPKKFSGDLFCSDTQTSCGISDCGIMDRCRGTYAKSFVQWSTDILSNFLCRGLGKGEYLFLFSSQMCLGGWDAIVSMVTGAKKKCLLSDC
ncbi:hypothetical protein CDAR_554051 [Caerostris darwini]|uniref:Secreted protein n=1 Tax=Caerostris darwini TaxID=1538125 RepID=A0AAV4X831_9ARAC|nr:hypothetical protein CDAR_554051 [Caerostris darwini]